ncbi:MAG: hypothetical protein HY675_10265 [Chloroflexi bacterium]|nr:hypothetical protein [Chloroflexota bacterium]
MKRKDQRRGSRPNVESQDDLGYITGSRPYNEQEKQVRTPSPRRSRKDVKPVAKDEEGDLH